MFGKRGFCENCQCLQQGLRTTCQSLQSVSVEIPSLGGIAHHLPLDAQYAASQKHDTSRREMA